MTAQNETDIPAEHAMTTEYLRELMGDANRLIKGKGVSFGEAQRIAGCIAKIRRLLDEWADLESRFVPARPIAEEVKRIIEGLRENTRSFRTMQIKT